ncbi:MAG TPA: T9SS type A sorting domain-containing protein [bacterium]
MDKRYLISTFVMLAFTLMLAAFAFAQRTVAVSPTDGPTPGFGALNWAITSDTTQTGARVDSTTVYVLQRDATYTLNGTISHAGYHLTVVAQDGSGERPRLIPGVVPGGESARPFSPRGDLTVQGLYMTGEDELGTVLTQIIRISADSVRIVVDDCHVDVASQAGFRLDNRDNKLFLTNSIFSNLGGDWDNGRGIDDRGNHIDSLLSVNNTWYNLPSRVLRDGGGYIRYAKFDQNTIVNTGRRVAEFGEVVELEFTNNLMINTGFLGQDTAATSAQIVVDSLSNADLVGLEQNVLIRNNNFYVDPVFAAVYGDSVESMPRFTADAQSFVDASGFGSTNISEAITFSDGPQANTADVTEFYESGGDVLTALPNLDRAGEPFDFTYPQAAASYSAGINGLPLGDLNWFGLAPVSVEDDHNPGLPSTVRLLNNYPNPFNPSTNIAYVLPNSALVKLTIYNIMGQKIRTLVNENQSAGEHRLEWNGTDDNGRTVSSGVYLYRLETPGAVQTHKMLLLK